MAKAKRHIRTVPLIVGYLLARLKFLHGVLPEPILYRLPTGWNFKMLRTFFLSRRKRVYVDVPARLRMPPSFRPKVETKPEYRLTDADVRALYENGYLGPYSMYTPEEAGAMKEELQAVYRSTSRIYPPGSYTYTGDTKASTGGPEMSNQEMAQKGINLRDRHIESRAVLDVFTHPAVVERIAQLLGPDLLIWRSQFFPKGPGEGGTAWHQASVYMLDNMLAPTVQPPDLRDLFQLTVWVAITDATIEGGALRIVPGTNKEIYPQLVEDFDPTKHEHEKEARFGTKILKIGYPMETAKIVDIPMKAGEFFIFSERTIHGALPNVTKDVHRLGMSARYITPGTKCYNPLVLNKTGLDFSLLRLKGLNMGRWRAVVVRGQDTVRANGDRTVTLEELHKEQAGATAGVAA